jgi:hypothetical protein
MPNYNEIFMTQFIQTLAQLSASVVTAVFAVPVYSYYVKGNLFSVTNEFNEYNEEISDIKKEKSSNVNNDDRSTNTDEDNEETETEQEDEL